jgi:hypothetical protein
MLLFMDGFDAQSTAQMAAGKWTAINSLVVEGSITRFGVGQSIQDASNSGYAERNIGSNLESGVIGAAFRLNTTGSAQNVLFILYDGSTPQLIVHRNADNTLSICRNTLATVLGTTTTTVAVDSSTWFYLELKFKIANSIASGDVELYINGALELTLAATTDTQHTANAYVTKYRLGGDSAIYNSTTTRRYIDDHYFLDLTGSYNNDVLGDVRVLTLRPDNNGNSSGLTGSDGNSVNNYLLVDDTTSHDTDSTYVESATPGTKDTYSFGDTLSNTATILGIQTNVIARKTDTAAKTVCPVIRIGSTDYDGTTTPGLSTSYSNYTEIYETKPSDSTPWTKSDVDGAEFGVKVVS